MCEEDELGTSDPEVDCVARCAAVEREDECEDAVAEVVADLEVVPTEIGDLNAFVLDLGDVGTAEREEDLETDGVEECGFVVAIGLLLTLVGVIDGWERDFEGFKEVQACPPNDEHLITVQ